MKTCVKLSISQTLVEININIDLTWDRISTRYFSCINNISHFELATFFTDKNSKDIVIQTIAYLYKQKTYLLSIILLKVDFIINNSFEIDEIFFKFSTTWMFLSHFRIWLWNLLFNLNFFFERARFLRAAE